MITHYIKIIVCYFIIISCGLISIICGHTWNKLYELHMVYVLLMIWCEMDCIRNLRFCKTKETREWTRRNIFSESTLYGLVLLIAFVVMGILQVVNLVASWGEFAKSFLIYIGIMTSCSIIIFSNNSQGYVSQYIPIKFNKVRGFQYRLPCWYFLPREMRLRLLIEMYKKVPVEGQPHLFISKRLFVTTVKIMTSDSDKSVFNVISKELLEDLKRYPKENIRDSLSDDMICIRRKRQIPRIRLSHPTMNDKS